MFQKLAVQEEWVLIFTKIVSDGTHEVSPYNERKFQWVLCHIGFSYPLILQTWGSVICTGCICQESAIQLSS